MPSDSELLLANNKRIDGQIVSVYMYTSPVSSNVQVGPLQSLAMDMQDFADISMNKVIDDNGLKKIMSGDLTVIISVRKEPKKISEMTDDEIVRETEKRLATWPSEPAATYEHVNLKQNLTVSVLPMVALFRLLNNRSPTIKELLELQNGNGPRLVK